MRAACLPRATGAAAIALLLLLAGCGAQAKGPNLDRAVAGMAQASIREQIAGHQDWGRRLTPEQLDELAAFIHAVAGASPAGTSGDAGRSPAAGTPVVDPPGLVLWRANACGTCHVLAAGGS